MSRGDRAFACAVAASLVLHAAGIAAMSRWPSSRGEAPPPVELIPVTFTSAAAADERAWQPVPSLPTSAGRRPVTSPLAGKPETTANAPRHGRTSVPASGPRSRVAALVSPGGAGPEVLSSGADAAPPGHLPGPGAGTPGPDRPSPVAAPDGGHGNGSGGQTGVEPVAPPVVRPAPEPARVRVRICQISGHLPGPYCQKTARRSFSEGKQPSQACSLCKAPEPPPTPRPVQSRPAQPLSSSPLRFPRSVGARTIDVSVECRWTVAADGSVRDAEVLRSSGIRDIDAEALRVVRSRKYRPAEQNGVPQSVQIRQQFNFRR